MKKLIALVLISLCGVGTFSELAEASHYRLPVSSLIEEPEAALLAKAGVTTTLELLSEVSSLAKRKRLSKASGLPLERLEGLAHQVDLLRVDGLGPSMVRLLQAAGVQNSLALAKESVATLLPRLQVANAGERFSPVLPPEHLLTAWISQARTFSVLLRDL